MVATPQAAAAAAQLLRGLNSTQEVALGIEYGLEPEWPPCPPSSLSTSPFAAYGLGSPESVLAAKVSRSSSLGLDAVPRKLESHLTSYETGVCRNSSMAAAFAVQRYAFHCMPCHSDAVKLSGCLLHALLLLHCVH